ncbi:MAG: outer membrane protein assembly factor BamB [Planctomycetota bacterium]|jgi:outer membrane protein assembly factor BamB
MIAQAKSTAPSRFLLPLLLITAPFAAGQEAEDPAGGADWPQWRGPERTGVSMEAGWNSVGAAKPLWNKQLGVGHSSFSVVGERVYTMGYDAEAGMDRIFCLDSGSGEEHWTHSYPSEIWDTAHDGGTLTTPTVRGDAVYTSNREGKVLCLDAKSGELRWQRDLRKDHELEPHTWGFSASPLLVGERLLMNLGKVLALDPSTGIELWVTERNYGIAYATPAAFELDGHGYLASLSGDGLAILNQEDGSEVAFHDWVKKPQIYPMTPVVVGNKIFISGGYDRGCCMLQFVDGKLEELWASRVMRNKMSGCVFWEDHLYGFDESILKCITLDGKMRWRKRGLGTGSMTIAGGRLIILDGKGQVIVAEANPEEYVELSLQNVLDEGTAWSTPILSHGRIYCRSSLGQMACLDYSAPEEASIATSLAVVRGSSTLPTAQSLLHGHGEAMGGAILPESLKSIRMTGAGESLRNTVKTGRVELEWAASGGFSWKDASGFQLAYNPSIGWELGGRGAPVILKDEPLDALHEAGSLTRLFNLAGTYRKLKTIERTAFDNRECYVVEAETVEGHRRVLYFEVESGLLAGHQGEGMLMWTLSDYRTFEGLLLPTRWAFYEPENGEMNSAVFDEVLVNPVSEADPFAVPGLVKLYMRTPKEVELANEALKQEHAGILGAWVEEPDEDGSEAETIRFHVADGFLNFVEPERGPSPLGMPDEQGRFAMIGASYVVFTPKKDQAGVVTTILVHVGGELEVRLLRAEED